VTRNSQRRQCSRELEVGLKLEQMSPEVLRCLLESEYLLQQCGFYDSLLGRLVAIDYCSAHFENR